MRYLITGGAGFIGSHLAERLASQGDEVRIVDDLSSGSSENLLPSTGLGRVQLEVLDVRETDVDKHVEWADAVFHLAAVVGVEQVWRKPRRTVSVTVEGGANVLAACMRHRRPLLVTSTSEVYGDNPSQPLRESMDLRIGPPDSPRWSYAAAKLVEEQMVLAEWRASGLPVVVCRLFNTVGPRQTGRYGMVVPRFVAWALDEMNLEVYGSGRQTRSFCDVRDVVSALALLIGEERAWGSVVNVGSDVEISIYKLAKLVIDIVGGRGGVSFVKHEDARGAKYREIRRRVPDVSWLTELIGDRWRVYPLEKTVEAVADHIRNAAAVTEEE